MREYYYTSSSLLTTPHSDKYILLELASLFTQFSTPFLIFVYLSAIQKNADKEFWPVVSRSKEGTSRPFEFASWQTSKSIRNSWMSTILGSDESGGDLESTGLLSRAKNVGAKVTEVLGLLVFGKL